MMKTTLFHALALAALLAGCAQDQPQAPLIGMANPASVFCKEQAGKLEMRKDASGNEYGMCHLPDGRVVDEWAFYREKHPQ
ncbi:DUF333 domain-containing protein [Chromobacterium sp. IIBBL 290-4]|uniref:putative hemolysin n=1 Tax=Chromobacterium sp. IIBBL 290-4 TaxID=2953890 RepID=UPI0020B72675|nr:DUF333 domain-containing protein [Chromobacterium sp. IIBBL 290-4]UTH75256.1 DUF333 domain-containing protein [Chromobacterium sp. IIBBL 290-4]